MPTRKQQQRPIPEHPNVSKVILGNYRWRKKTKKKPPSLWIFPNTYTLKVRATLLTLASDRKASHKKKCQSLSND